MGDMPSAAAVVRCRVRSLTPIAAATLLICSGSVTWSRTHRSNAVIVGSVGPSATGQRRSPGMADRR